MFLRATPIVTEEICELGSWSAPSRKESGKKMIPPHFPFFTTVLPPACFRFPSACLISRSPFFDLPFGETGDGNLALIMIGLTIETVFRPPLIPTIPPQRPSNSAAVPWSCLAVIHTALLQTRAYSEIPGRRSGHSPRKSRGLLSEFRTDKSCYRYGTHPLPYIPTSMRVPEVPPE